jgi:hypothetical protein
MRKNGEGITNHGLLEIMFTPLLPKVNFPLYENGSEQYRTLAQMLLLSKVSRCPKRGESLAKRQSFPR